MYDFQTGKERDSTFIDEDDRLRYYDNLCTVTYTNLFTLSKNSPDIKFNIDFKPDEKETLFVLNVAIALASASNKKISLNIPKLKLYSYICKHFGTKYLKFKTFKSHRGPEGIYPFDIVNDMVTAFKVDRKIFADIYDEYYAKEQKEK